MKQNLLQPLSVAVLSLSLTMLLSAAALAAPSPVDVQRQSVDGDEFVIKIYELPPDSDPAALIEDTFKQDGFSFAHHTTTSQEIPATETKTVSETRTAESSSKALENVLKKFPATIPYEQDGYTGTLILDTGSISTEVAGHTTSSRTISAAQTYPGMLYQDPSAIPQTTIKDGVTLPLSGVSWTVTGTSLAGDSLVPTEYTATATYSKKVSSSVPSGYVSTATYSGEVSKTGVSSVIYTLTYLGTAIPEPEPEPASEPFPWGVLMSGLAVLLALGGGVLVVLYLRSRQGAAVFNLIEDDYLCIGRQKLDYKQPVIDLNEFADVVQSNYFSFVLDKASTRKLFGRNLTVTQGDITMTHRVKDMEGKYRFNLEMGVEL